MSASLNAIAGQGRPETLIRLSSGRRVYLEDVRTQGYGRALLGELDAIIFRIERQLSNDLKHPDEPGWRRRAADALRLHRKARLALADHVAALPASHGPERRDAQRIAFINAAEQVLDRDLFIEIWQRASENEPAAFQSREGA